MPYTGRKAEVSARGNARRIVKPMATSAALVAILALAAAGCGKGSGPKVVPVSGTVTIDGKPAPNIAVVFQPVASGKEEAGMGSTGVTDAQGRFTLTLTGTDKRPGAVVGRHRVTFSGAATQRAETDDTVRPGVPDPVPARYREKPLEFEVPAGGTDKADFKLESGGGPAGGPQPTGGFPSPQDT